MLITLYSSKVPAGFPSPADDYVESALDLNKHLIKRPAATFFVTVAGDSMIHEGIHDKDTLIVDRSIKSTSGDIVVAVIDGQLTVKKLLKTQQGQVFLMPANPKYSPLKITEAMELHIWGVVIHVIHSYKRT